MKYKKLMTTCIVVASGLSLISCNGGGGSSGSATNQSVGRSVINTGINFPTHGGNNIGTAGPHLQYSGLYSSPVSTSNKIITPMLATIKTAYALELTGTASNNHQEASIVAYPIKSDGTLGPVLGSSLPSGNFNLNDINGTFRDEGNLIAINKKGTKLYVLNTFDRDISVFIIEDDGSLTSSGSYPLSTTTSGYHPVSINTMAVGGNDYVVVMDDNGSLEKYLISNATLGPVQVYPNANAASNAKFDVITVANRNIYTIDNYNNSLWSWSIDDSATPTLTNATALATGINPISAVAAMGYVYILNRGSLSSGGQSSVTYYKEGANGSAPTNQQTYSDNFGNNLVAKAIRTDGKHLFIFYSMPLSGSTAQNKVVSYYIDPIGGSLFYNAKFNFGKNPLGFVSGLSYAGQSAASLLNLEDMYTVDQPPPPVDQPSGTSVSNVTPFSNMSGVVSKVKTNNILADEDVGASVVKMAPYTIGGNFAFFMIKTASGQYKLKVDSISSSDGTNALNGYLSRVNINTASSFAINGVNKLMDMMLLGQQMYILGMDANRNEVVLAYTIISDNSGITLTPLTNILPTPLVQITDATIKHNRFLWGGNNIATILFVLLNNNQLQEFTIQQGDNSLIYSSTLSPPIDKTMNPIVQLTDFNDAHFGYYNGLTETLYWRPKNGSHTFGVNMTPNGTFSTEQFGLADICGSGVGYIAPGTGITQGSPTRRMFAVVCDYNNQADNLITFGTNGPNVLSPLNTTFNATLDKLIFTESNDLAFLLHGTTNLLTIYADVNGGQHNQYGQVLTGLFQDTYLNGTAYAQDLNFFSSPSLGGNYVLILDSDGSLILYRMLYS